jgi:hypothetical protein
MTDSQSFTIDILKIVPNDSVCYIQAPSLEEPQIEDFIKPSEFAYYKQIELNPDNKKLLTNLIISNKIEIYFQTMEIKQNNLRIFIAYDGMEIGEISVKLLIPYWFKLKYIDSKVCAVSKDW